MDSADSSNTYTLSFKESHFKRCINVKLFVACLALLVLLASTYRAYEISTVTTLEHEFHLRSSQTGFWLSSYDITHLVVVVAVAYWGGKGHIPRILAGSSLTAAVCMALGSLPHFLYMDHTTAATINATQCDGDRGMCDVLDSERNHGDCDATNDGRSSSSFSILVVVNVCAGLGLSGLYSLGLTYVDDNSARQQAPHLMGVVFSMYALGHVLGFGFGAGIAKLKGTDLYSTVPWWIGFIVLGVVIIIPSIPLTMFPKSLQPTTQPSIVSLGETGERVGYRLLQDFQRMSEPGPSAEFEKLSVKGLFKAIWRLIRNPVYIGLNLMLCFQLNHITVLGSFFPKYIKEEFGQHVWVANLLTALAASCAGFGLYFGGFILTKLKLSISQSSKMIAAVMVFISLTYIARLLIGCDTGVTSGIRTSTNDTCSGNCHCTQEMFHLVCGADNVTYRSPCHAGCLSSNRCTDKGKTEYQDCECVSNALRQATEGPCHQDTCQVELGVYVAITLLSALASSMASIPTTVISLRAIHAEDKPLSLAMHSVMTSLFAFIPGPIIAGLAADNACEEWQTKSCEPGAMLCRAYNPEKFRLYLHAIALVASVIAAILSLFVVYKCNHSITFNTLGEEDVASLQSNDSDDDIIENGGRRLQILTDGLEDDLERC